MSEGSPTHSIWKRLVLFLVIGLSVLLLLFSPIGHNWGASAFLVLLVVLLNLFLIWRLFAAQPREAEVLRPHMIYPDEQPAVIREVMDVRVATDDGGVRIFRGHLLESPATVFEKLKATFGSETTAMLQDDEKLGAAIYLMPAQIERVTMERSSRPIIHWLLLLMTVLTTTWAGAFYLGVNLLRQPEKFAIGLPYALGLIAILGCHELGHYFAARAHKMNVTPPFFIPVPFALGTFGAFIKMRSPPEDRTSLFDMAVAGPLAGLVVAIPTLLIGLRHSKVLTELPPGFENMAPPPPTSSVLFQVLAQLSFRADIMQHGYVELHPLAFAGTLGLLVTALNLMPIGQLDGGHIARAMFGTRVGTGVGRAAMLLLFVYAIKEPTFLVWAFVVFFLTRTVTPPLNDLTPITAGRKALGWITFVILALIIPLPDSWMAWLMQHFPA